MDQKRSTKKNFSVIFLLAGYGKRIAEVTNKPKCLLKINDITIIERNLLFLKKNGIKNIIFVLGYKSHLIKKILQKYKKFFNFHFAYNKNYKKCGNTYSLFKGLKKSKNDTLIFDGDIIFSQKILISFLENKRKSSLLVGKGSLKNIECAKTLIDKKGFVRKTVDKRAVKKSELKAYKFIGEAVGIIKISNENRIKMTKHLSIFLKKKENLSLNWEHFMNEFLKKNDLRYSRTDNSQWIEIDTKQDYVEAITLFKKND